MTLPTSGAISLSQLASFTGTGTGTTVSLGDITSQLIAGNTGTRQVISLGQCYFSQSATLTGTVQGTPVTPTDSQGQGSSVALSADGNTLASGDPGGGKVFVFTRSAGSWSQLTSITVSSGFGTSVALSYDGSTLAVQDATNVKLYIYKKSGNTYTQQYSSNLAGALSTSGDGLVVSADGKTVAVGCGSFGAVQIFIYTTSWALSQTLTTGDQYLGRGLALSADGNFLVACASNTAQKIYYWVNNSGVWGSAQTIFELGYSSPIWTIAMSADGLTIALGAYGGSNSVWVMRSTSGRSWTSHVVELNYFLIGSGSYYGYSLALSADGNTLAIGDWNGGSPSYCFIVTRTGSTWSLLSRKSDNNISYQGWSVAIGANGKVIASGAQQGPIGYNGGGCVFVYT